MPLPRSFHVRHLLRLRSFSAAAEAQTQKLECIADELLSLNRLEHYDFNILFRLKLGLDRWGAAGPPGAGLSTSAAPAAVASEAATDKTVFDVKLEKFDAAAKLKVIKEVRSFTDLGLKEAKSLVEKAPVVLKKAIPKEDAEKIAAKLKEIGATISLE